MSALREALVDVGAIESNVRTLKAAVGGMQTMTVVKADGYGHGAVQAALAALDGGTDWLGVADLDEALELRRAAIREPLLAWLHAPDAAFAEAIEADIDLGISNAAQLEAAAAAGRASVHIKVDTGLGRNGVAESEWPATFARAAELERQGRLVVRGVFSHLALAGDTADAAQIDSFERALAIADESGVQPELRHLAATDAALRLPEARFDLVRFGIGSYGLSPFGDRTSEELGLTPAMQLSANVVSVKRVPVGTGISYGHDIVTERETTLALIPLGYADGVPRAASGRGPVRIGDRTYTVAGRIAMDQFVVDVGDHEVAVGDRAVLFGDPATGAPSADEWGIAAGTINYEIVTRLGRRVERRYRP